MIINKEKLLEKVLDQTELKRIWEKLENEVLIVTRTQEPEKGVKMEWREKPSSSGE